MSLARSGMHTSRRSANRRRKLGAALLVAVPLGVVLILLWRLHGASPEIGNPVAINRNSLLPHRYAGPCVNCHRVVEVGPIAMNRDNLQAFHLSGQEQRLLLAGQRVEVPTVSQLLRIPAITRTDGLPHPYVGVCSNCHVVLDVHPSPEFMARAMQLAGQPLVGSDLAPAAIARAGVAIDHERARYRVGWGWVALPLLLLTSVYVVLRQLGRAKPSWRWPLERWLTVHAWAGGGFAVAACMHWYYSDRGNNFLHLALLAVLWLVVGGSVLRLRLAKILGGSGVMLLHTQRFVFLALIALAAAGHFLAPFH
jgi:hypothetical protein